MPNRNSVNFFSSMLINEIYNVHSKLPDIDPKIFNIYKIFLTPNHTVKYLKQP